ncbi:hypothetical protein XA68_11019 [Ophiocordyceps unilateralis]|uniref:Mo25-like protein n=1 Tax=Ophiocordyceps unilateralis TaxID=268505 RepID=A0A2A9P2D3_OPHUN|nr:hypothetical protein XA68_11019 [Ophiocordyceps unilateralis]
MSFLFGRARGRAVADLSKQAYENISRLDGPNGAAKAEELVRVLNQMKLVLQGTNETDSSPEQIHQLVTGLIDEDLLYLLANNLYRLPFESRKDTQVIFSYVFRFRTAAAANKSDPIALSYVVSNRPQVLIELCQAYEHKESATPAGSVLRELLKNEDAASIILHDDGDEPGSSAKGLNSIDRERPQSGRGVFWRFFDWIDKSSFEVAADAFTTFRELLTRHKDLVPRYLSLLGEILLDRSNYSVMTAYVDRGDHLKICMNLLRDDRKMSIAVQKILLMNREKLLNFLAHFLEDRTDDEQFIDEREFLVKQIKNMSSTPIPPKR